MVVIKVCKYCYQEDALIFQIVSQQRIEEPTLCVCVCVDMYIYLCIYCFVCTCAYPCMWRPKIDVVCLSNGFLQFFWCQGLSRNLELTDGLDLLASKSPGFSCLSLPSTVNTGAPRLCVLGNLNSGPCACMASTFLTELSPQPWWSLTF